MGPVLRRVLERKEHRMSDDALRRAVLRDAGILLRSTKRGPRGYSAVPKMKLSKRSTARGELFSADVTSAWSRRAGTTPGRTGYWGDCHRR